MKAKLLKKRKKGNPLLAFLFVDNSSCEGSQEFNPLSGFRKVKDIKFFIISNNKTLEFWNVNRRQIEISDYFLKMNLPV